MIHTNDGWMIVYDSTYNTTAACGDFYYVPYSYTRSAVQAPMVDSQSARRKVRKPIMEMINKGRYERNRWQSVKTL